MNTIEKTVHTIIPAEALGYVGPILKREKIDFSIIWHQDPDAAGLPDEDVYMPRGYDDDFEGVIISSNADPEELLLLCEGLIEQHDEEKKEYWRASIKKRGEQKSERKQILSRYKRHLRSYATVLPGSVAAEVKRFLEEVGEECRLIPKEDLEKTNITFCDFKGRTYNSHISAISTHYAPEDMLAFAEQCF